MRHRLLLVDDHPILTDGLKMIFKDSSKFEVVMAVPTGNHALALLKTQPIDVLVVDYSLPDMNGIELIRRVRAACPAAKIVMLTMHDDGQVIKDAISAGADGYILKRNTMSELTVALETVMNGQPYMSPEASQKLFRLAREEENYEPLTDHEIEVKGLIIKELTNKEIAAQLFISDRTVEVHRKNLLRKTKCNSTVGLIKYAFAQNMV